MLKLLGKISLSVYLVFVSLSLNAQLNLGGSFTIKNQSIFSITSRSANSGDVVLAFGQTADIIVGLDTLSHNSSFSNSTLRIMNVTPIGAINWSINSERNFNGNISDIISGNDGRYYLIGSFVGFLKFGNLEIQHTDTNSVSNLEYFIICLDAYGNLDYLKKMPASVNSIVDASINKKSELLLSVAYDSIMNIDNFIVNELPASNASNSGASAIVKIDYAGTVSNIISTDCDGVDGSSFITTHPQNGNILSICGFGVAPPFEPSIQPFSFNFLEFDSNGTYLRYREVNIDLLGNTSAGLMQNGNFVFRVDNDSVELQYPCQNVQPGSDKLGYFNYELGPFSFPSKCQVYGAPSFFTNNPSIFSDDLIGERFYHPGGIYTDNAVYDSSDYSILAFDPDSSKLAWFKGFNIPINQMAFDEGHQIVGISLVDSIIVIDSLTFTHELGTTESLFLSYYDCNYFNPEPDIREKGDTIGLLAADLKADWYVNGNLTQANAESYIVPNQTGTYHAVMKNAFGCTQNSDSLFVIASFQNDISNKLKIYPNPTNNYIRFESDLTKSTTIDIYDIRGKFIRQQTMKEELILNIANWTPGIYIYKIESVNGIFNGKFIKQ
ncbi:MAG: T9SS type A sorting domain-containing protein [Cytophagales bacterium]